VICTAVRTPVSVYMVDMVPLYPERR